MVKRLHLAATVGVLPVVRAVAPTIAAAAIAATVSTTAIASSARTSAIADLAPSAVGGYDVRLRRWRTAVAM